MGIKVSRPQSMLCTQWGKALLFYGFMMLLLGCEPGADDVIDPPNPPQNVVAEARNEAISLQWSNAVNANVYKIYWKTTSSVEYSELIQVDDSLSYEVGELINNQSYSFFVIAINRGGASGASSEVQAIPQPPPGAINIVEARSGDGSVTLQWESVAGADKYHLYISMGQDLPVKPERCLAGIKDYCDVKSPFTLSELNNGVTYYYLLTAANSSGESEGSWKSVMPFSLLTIMAGRAHSCLLKIDHTLWCWGANSYGQLGDNTGTQKTMLVRIGDRTDWMMVTSGANHTCAIDGESYLWCWGSNFYGQLGNGEFGDNRDVTVPMRIGHDTDWMSVAAGKFHTCGLKTDGSLWCWGTNDFGQYGDGSKQGTLFPRRIGEAIDWQAIVAGADHMCGLKNNQSLWCWGANARGQLGDGTVDERSMPIQVGNESNWRMVVAGEQYSCALRSDHHLWCWGDYKQASINEAPMTEPVRIGSGNWVSVKAGRAHTCAIKMDGTLWCWGDNQFGQLGDGSLQDKKEPAHIGIENAHWRDIALGDAHTCGLASNDSLWCWGSNSQGQLGDAMTVTFAGNKAMLVDETSDWKRLAAGENHTCAIKIDDTLWCWGANNFGQMGDGTFVHQYIPRQVDETADWQDITLGQSHTCGVKNNNNLWCWGLSYGFTKLLQLANEESQWRDSTAGATHSCAVKVDGTLWCWGKNGENPLGDGGGQQAQTNPIQIGQSSDWDRVAAGNNYTCVIKIDATLWCWGDNSMGQLGDGTKEPRAIPVQVGTDNQWRLVVTGNHYTCAIKINGSLWCWGRNEKGQLGEGSQDQKMIPTPVGDEPWLDISVGRTHSCAIKLDRSLWCWGNNDDGQLGDHTRLSTSIPVMVVSEGVNWQFVAVGEKHSCALTEEGRLWCWGGNQLGQLGRPITRNTPQKIKIIN